MSRICKIFRICKIIGAEDCSSGAPAPERRIARRTASGPVARGPVPRDLSQNEKRQQPRDHGRLLLRPTHGEGQALALR